MSKKNSEIEIGGKINVVNKDAKIKAINVNGSVIYKLFETVYITKVKYNGPATIVFWSDNTKTVTKCSPNDVYSPETGLAICCLKKIMGASDVFKLFDSWLPLEDEFIPNCELDITKTLSDVRRKARNR